MSYDLLSAVWHPLELMPGGGVVQRARVAHLEALRGRSLLFAPGEGLCRLVAAALSGHPSLRVRVVDSSRGMLRVGAARLQRCRHGARVDLIHGDATGEVTGSRDVDAVVTCLFLDPFTRVRMPDVVRSLAARTVPGAVWLDVDFALPEPGPARVRALTIHRLMHAFFRRVAGIEARSWTDPGPWLAAAGFEPRARREYSAGLLRADLWQRRE